MKTLFLHIGSHKTGTTSIQMALFHNRALLECNGLHVFNRDPNGQPFLMYDGSGWIKSHYSISDGRLTLTGTHDIDKEPLFKYLSDYDGDVIFSAEHLSWLNSENDINALKKEAEKHFSRVVIIVYIRRQDRQVLSQHNQGSKIKFGTDHIYYNSNNRSIPMIEDNYYEYLDYNKKLAIWADAFGDENIIVRIFERDSLIGGDVVEDFFHIIEAPYEIKEENRNLANGFEKTKIGHLANMHLSNELGEMIRRGSANSGQLKPSKAAAEEFYSRYVESNIRLNQRFKISPRVDIFNDDFSDYPVEAQDLWGEDTANQAISNVLKSFERAYGRLTIDKLKAIVLMVEDKNLSLAIDLLAAIQEINPQGHFVAEKLAEYELGNTQENTSPGA